VAGAETEIPAGGLALRSGEGGARQAGEFVPVEQAERRNLIMVNPVAATSTPPAATSFPPIRW
jgi:hypothetical protein